jgi:hypothetical protein
MTASITPQLLAATRDCDPSDVIVVVIELGGAAPEDASPDLESARTRFQQAAEPIRARIRELGGVVLGESWLSGTLECRVPASAVAALQERADVAVLDVPHRVSRE